MKDNNMKARCHGITRAAKNLYITPSALSKFIMTRESELSVQLFRSHRCVVL
ncbi:MAG: LysR family transcriptional regulator [Oribacterium sp.]|nr:LysR family transcriptional regulator [Oribacterium sp.]MDY6317302.1 LysR family transcriptional regulator [Oribacterium sp.]